MTRLSLSALVATAAATASLAACPAHAAPLPAAAPDVACTPQSSFDALAISQQVLLAGELHGTNEMPGFVAGLACSLLKGGRQVVLSLEVPSDVQPAIDSFVTSDGSEAARQPLYASQFGQLNDGRGSQAYMPLIELVRQLRQQGARISVAATDMARNQDAPPKAAQWDPNARDRIMAANILALAKAHPEAKVLSLSGNLHASQQKGGMHGDRYEPLGYVLAQQLPVYSIGFLHAGGSAWMCLGDGSGKPACKAHDLGAQKKLGLGGYNRLVTLKGLSASPPVGRL